MPHGAGYWPLLPGIVVLSVGQGMSWTAMWIVAGQGVPGPQQGVASGMAATAQQIGGALRSEEHTSELQSQSNLVCRLLLEKKKTYIIALYGKRRLNSPARASLFKPS